MDDDATFVDDMPIDAYENASLRLMYALTSGEFDDFEKLLGENVKTILYKIKTIRGKAATCTYFRDWYNYEAEKLRNLKWEVKFSHYYSHYCLTADEKMLFLFRIEHSLMVQIVVMPCQLSSSWSDDNMLNYPFDPKRISPFMTPLVEPVTEDGELIEIDNRVPCLHCGVESSDLLWHISKLPHKPNVIIGQMSRCLKCGRIVEYYPFEIIDSEIDMDNIPLISNYSDKGNTFSNKAIQIYMKKLPNATSVY